MSDLPFRDRLNEAMDAFYKGLFGWFIDTTLEIGLIFSFTFHAVLLFFKPPFRFRELIQHMEFVGNKSVFIICLTGLFTGMALSFQIYLGFEIVNATALVGPTVAMGITRELGPVLTGMIVAARAGGAMAARLGTMRVTEQIDALEVMAVHPIQYLVSPRIIAAMICVPLLNAAFVFVAMIGSYLLVVKVLDLDEAIFWEKTAFWVNPSHINEGLFKSAIFGFMFGAVCCYQGFNAKGGAKGVGDATNQGVVTSMVMIIVLDFFLMKFIDIFYRVAGFK
jgi:phospholipid/cholesterol/gamma-HCH transport system permease protein